MANQMLSSVVGNNDGKGGSVAGWVLGGLYTALLVQCFYLIFMEAYKIRMYAINEYGRIIHEFDPYFNYRATEYLYANGWTAFKQWYDMKVWYPLGRPVGTTIYPGMQITAVFIKNHILKDWSINDICCFVPAWFGVLATIATALLAYECTCQHGQYRSGLSIIPFIYDKLVRPVVEFMLNFLNNQLGTTFGLDTGLVNKNKKTPAVECAFFAAAIMSVVPAHLLRSVGGGYDNESVATFAMVITFYCWTRTLRPSESNITTIIWGIVTGLAYYYMVLAWGGYVFVLNLIGVHASALVALGRFSDKLYYAYTAFYLVGTYLATTVPVVGMTPLKSLEQLGPFVAFGAFQLLQGAERILKSNKDTNNDNRTVLRWKYRVMLFTSAGIVAIVISYFILVPIGYFGPLSSRVRGLFVKHTKTGNPLVDSVAEHQPASKEAYFQYLNNIVHIAPYGFGIVSLFFFNDSSSFLIVYTLTAYFFSTKMVRLILLTAPIASVLAGIALGHLWSWMIGSIFTQMPSFTGIFSMLLFEQEDDVTETVQATPANDDVKTEAFSKSKKNKKANKSKAKPTVQISKIVKKVLKGDPIYVRALRFGISVYICKWIYDKNYAKDFHKLSHDMALAISHPTIIQKARTNTGETVIVDDYRQAYFWLRDNTPEDARIMAWWDYGYQITGISERTTIADGNTWNHEHIALLGRALTSPEKEGHRIARHLADYVLVWAGGGGDDLAKSPHLIRIANSVYRGLCDDPTCSSFGMFQGGVPSPHMSASMLYKLHSHGLKDGVVADRNRFKLVHQTKYGKVRIFKILKVSQESKAWVLDPKNRLCDGGGWLCKGQYPPALQKVLKQKKDFQQLEDFNTQGGDDSEYQRQYMENVMGKNKDIRDQHQNQQKRKQQQPDKKPQKKLNLQEIEVINSRFVNDESTTMMWQLISEKKHRAIKQMLKESPRLAHIRSSDGRGPMWWAYENKDDLVVKLLKSYGVSDRRTDEDGVSAFDLRG